MRDNSQALIPDLSRTESFERKELRLRTSLNFSLEQGTSDLSPEEELGKMMLSKNFTNLDTSQIWNSMSEIPRDDDSKKNAMSEAFKIYITGGGEKNRHGQAKRYLSSRLKKMPLINHKYDAGCGPFIFSEECIFSLIWEVLLISCVFWTLFITPFEVAIDYLDFLVYADQFATIVFMLDVLVNFNTAYHETTGEGSKVIFDRQLIVLRYLRSSFVIDVISAIPFEFIIGNSSTSSMTRSFKVLRLSRIVRVAKLQRAHLLNFVEVPYYLVAIIKILLVAVVATHWMACLWCGLLEVGPSEENWLTALIEAKVGMRDDVKDDPALKYMWSAYFAITLITTVGFGDVTPQNTPECVTAICGIFLGSMFWAYAVSFLMNVVSRMDPHRGQFETNVDEVQAMMDDHQIPAALQHDIRGYFMASEEMWKFEQRTKLIERLSPALRGRITLAMSGGWIEKVGWSTEIFTQRIPRSTAFIAELATQFDAELFSPGERLPLPKFYIIRKGVVSVHLRIVSCGDVVGDDFMVENPLNRSPWKPFAMTMVGTLSVTNDAMAKTLQRYPQQSAVVRKWACWTALKNGTVRVVREITRDRAESQGHEIVRSPRSPNTGPLTSPSALISSLKRDRRSKGSLIPVVSNDSEAKKKSAPFSTPGTFSEFRSTASSDTNHTDANNMTDMVLISKSELLDAIGKNNYSSSGISTYNVIGTPQLQSFHSRTPQSLQSRVPDFPGTESVSSIMFQKSRESL
jgi:voltage-gated potassium channel